MGKAASPAQSIDPLAALQKRFSLITISSEIRVIDELQVANLANETAATSLSYFKRTDASLLMRRFIETLPVSCDPRRVVADFIVDPNTRMYKQVAFSPLKTPPDALNLWSPSPVKPVKGDWSVIQEFLFEVLCNGDPGLFDYLIQFLAHMLQRPEEKPGIMPVMLGGQGIGKGTLFVLLRAIYPATTLLVDRAEHVTVGFNAGLERSFVVCLDEAIFQGDRKTLDCMKSLITESHITVEAKYEPRRVVQSFHRFFAASNHQHFAHVEPDDRRFLFLRISEVRKLDFDYFEFVNAHIADKAVISAFVHDLLAFDLTGFRVRQRPRTKEHLQQKLQSLEGFARFWFDILYVGSSETGLAITGSWLDGIFISTTELKARFETFAKAARHSRLPTEHDFHIAIKRWCPSATRSRKAIGPCQLRGYELPPLQQARQEFERELGEKIDWPDDGGAQ